ncbi:hypothetical protein O181_091804 [Austropuccinia psidii MF-1]|uniref:Uncharacterized protein n=1 Tax=Austropuccinia psidii MF-1 TaxID=1389203 RepID=A0A9Q3IY23_9BASI|nr:hypothetical protein [Austropuccinia psidii MF-1]
MPSTRSGAIYNPSRSSQKGYRHEYGRNQSDAERQGSVNENQTEKLYLSEADNTVLPSNGVDTATRSLSGHIKSQPECSQQCTSAQRVSNLSRHLGKLHELSYCNNHSPGVRVFINTPTQTPQISRSTICSSIKFQQSSLLKHAYSLVLQYSLSTSVQVGLTQYSLDPPL